MARFLKPLVRSGGYYPSRRWTPLVYPGGYTTANGGGEPEPPPIEKTITGNPIHILDALAKPVQALSIALEPVQDLHGYSYPWPAGGGKNVLQTLTEAQTVNGVTATPNADGSITLTGTASAIAYFDIITGFDSTAYAGYIVTGLPDGMASNSSTICYRISTASNRASLQDIQRGASGTYVSNTIVDNGTNLVFSLRVNNGYALPNGGLTLYPMMRASSASADFAPYSNICPISGWTGAKVTRTGKNLFDKTGVTLKPKRYINYNTGDFGSSQNYNCTSTFIPCSNLRGKTISISPTTGANSTPGVAFYESNNLSSFIIGIKTNGYNGITVPNNASYYRISIPADNNLNDIQVELGSTATAYEPYSGDTYSITFPSEAGTVYGGTLDVTTGKLTVDRAMVDLGTLTWYTAAAQRFTRFRAPVIGIKQIDSPNVLGAIVCSSYATKTANQTYTGSLGISLQQNANDVYIYDPQKEAFSAADFKSAMSGVQLCYGLATPIVYDLTPTEVTLLLGENNIWSDGEMTLTYLADGNASDEEALNILLGGRYVNNHSEDEPTDREALNIILGGNER